MLVWRALRFKSFYSNFNWDKYLSEDFWVPTYSEELITSANELITKNWDITDSVLLRNCCWFWSFSAMVPALQHPHQCMLPYFAPFLRHSQACEQVSREGAGCTCISAPLVQSGPTSWVSNLCIPPESMLRRAIPCYCHLESLFLKRRPCTWSNKLCRQSQALFSQYSPFLPNPLSRSW